MYRRILIATDGSELALRAVTQGLALAKALGAKATAITVIGDVPHGALQVNADAVDDRALIHARGEQIGCECYEIRRRGRKPQWLPH
jgi:nucleotide-binding universal stress UspA family protein